MKLLLKWRGIDVIIIKEVVIRYYTTKNSSCNSSLAVALSFGSQTNIFLTPQIDRTPCLLDTPHNLPMAVT